jgi:hypothetical protein
VQTEPLPVATETGELPTPRVMITRAPDAKSAAGAFLESWKNEDYEAMYNLLSASSRSAISLEDFTARYKDVTINLTLKTLDYEVIARLNHSRAGQSQLPGIL